MYPFDYPHNCNNPRNCNVMPNRKEDDQHPSPHFDYPQYPSTYLPPPYYRYGPPHPPYVQSPPAPLPPCYYPHYYPPHPTYFIPPPPPCSYPLDHHHPCYDDYYKHQNNITHCCGCSNHTCQPRNAASSSLRIQEEPFNQPEKKESDDVVPPSNYAPPIIWRLPSSDSVKASSNNNDKYVGKPSEKVEVGKKDSQSPSYPVIWLPGNSGIEEMARDKNATASKPAQEWPSNFKFVPLKFLENGRCAEPQSEVHHVAPAVDKMSNLRAIPVKKVDDRDGNVDKAVEGVERNQPSIVKNVPLKCADNGEGGLLEKDIQQEAHDPVVKKGIKVKTIPVKHEESSAKSSKMASDENKEENKIVGKEESKTTNNVEKGKVSTTKSSKLPPVCLRVDPRPRKTSANSSSTSKPTTTTTTGAKNNKDSNSGNEEPIREKMIPVNVCNQSEPVIPINIVKDNKPSQDKKEVASEESVTVASPEKNASIDDSSKTSEVISKESNAQNCEKTGKENLAKPSEQKTNADEEKAVEPTGKIEEKSSGSRVLSDSDAATIIQSAYRGFEVRKWHPLEKLKKIAKVRKETENVRRQVDDIEACPPRQLDAKKKVVLGETIMNLLLQLDMIQGLLPSVKEVRKRLANDLTTLEDKLESIFSRKAKEVESSKCESNIVCSAPETSKLESSTPDSMGDKVAASDGEIQTISDGGYEHVVQVDVSGTKNNEAAQEEKPPSFKGGIEKEERSEEVKQPCYERYVDSTVSTTSSSSSEPFKPASEDDTNKSNVLVHQAEDEHVSSKQDAVNFLEEEKARFVVESPADYAEPNEAAQEEKPPSAEDGIEKKETSEEVKLPYSERDMDSTVSATSSSSSEPFKPASEEDTNQSNVLVHQAEDEHASSEKDSVNLLEEEKARSIVESPADYAEPNEASVEVPSVNIVSDDALGKRNDSTSDKPDSVGDKMSTSDAELQGRSDVGLIYSSSGDDGAVDVTSSTQNDVQVDDNAIKNIEIVEEEKLQHVKEGVEEEEISGEVKGPSFEKEVESNVSTASVENMNPSDILHHQVVDEHFTLKEDKVGDLEEEKDNSAEQNIASDELPSINDDGNRMVESMNGEEERSSAIKADGESMVIGNESENTSEAVMVDEEDKQVVSESFNAPRNIEEDCSKSEVFVSNEGLNVAVGKEGDEMKKEEVQLMGENEKLRKMIEELVQSGNKQLDVINSLNGRVKDLEKKLQQTKKKRMTKVRRNRAVKSHHSNEVGGK